MLSILNFLFISTIAKACCGTQTISHTYLCQEITSEDDRNVVCLFLNTNGNHWEWIHFYNSGKKAFFFFKDSAFKVYEHKENWVSPAELRAENRHRGSS